MTGEAAVAVLIAPDKFKGSLAAPEVADAVAAGLRRVNPDLAVRIAPVADGGDGTVRAAVAAGYRSVPVRVTGPVGELVETEIAVDGSTAVVEMATASGLALLDQRNLAPMTAHSTGTGEAVAAALDAGARTVVLGVGGSASTDGGAGLLAALGARITDADGREVPAGGAGLRDVAAVDLSTLDSRLSGTDIVLASDVNNPLLGENGAARVYGPQKGAEGDQIGRLDAALGNWASALRRAGGRDVAAEPGAGAAGGVGFAALAALGARMRPGVDVVLELVDFAGGLAGAELVVTGEGSLDEQTLHGKGPAGVAERARAADVPVIAVAGVCSLPPERLRAAGFAGAHALTDIEPDAQRCLDRAAELLAELGEKMARDRGL